MTPAPILTQDGSHTLRHPIFGDTYHSLRGALGEARYVFIEQGLLWYLNRNELSVGCSKDRPLRLLEVGFGSGLNVMLSAREAQCRPFYLYCETLELYPLTQACVKGLCYAEDPLFMTLHRLPWEEPHAIDAHFTLLKRHTSLLEYTFSSGFDVIYFDAFAPDTQPELWSLDVFRKLADSLAPQGVLVTYSAKGMVKENLRGAGLSVQRLPGALGKRHMLRAIKL